MTMRVRYLAPPEPAGQHVELASGEKLTAWPGRGGHYDVALDAKDDARRLVAAGWVRFGLVCDKDERPTNLGRGYRLFDPSSGVAAVFDGRHWRDHTGALV